MSRCGSRKRASTPSSPTTASTVLTGVTVVEPQRGGRSGGGTELTREGRALLEAFHTFRREVEEHMQSACHRHFAKWAPR